MVLRSRSLVLSLSVFIFASALPVHALAPAGNAGVTWLRNHQNSGGSWGTVPELIPRDTARTLMALPLAGAAAPPSGYAWLSAQGLDANELLAEQAQALASGKLDPSAALGKLASQHSGSAADFGGFVDHNGDTYDSALALEAFSLNESLYAANISGILTTLMARQNPDGGWGIDRGFTSNPLLTGEVLIGMSMLRKQTAPAPVISAAQTYLRSMLHADGSIGDGVLSTAVALRALALSDYVINSFSPQTFSYLASKQSTDGSWSEDAYTTARVVEGYTVDQPNVAFVPGSFVLTPSSVAQGAPVTATATIVNNGTQLATSEAISVFLGNSQLTPLATIGIGWLQPGQTLPLKLTFNASMPSGSQTITIVADANNQLTEVRKDDNTATATLTVSGKADLAVFPSDITLTPSRPQPNQSAQLSVTIHNYGEGDVGGAGYAIYQTNGSALETLFQKGTTGPLPSLGAQTLQFPVTLPGGTTMFRVVADPDNLIAETDKTNNQATKSFSISNVSNVDLLVRPGSVVATPAQPAPGTPITITAIIANAGTDPVPSATVAFYDGVPGAGGTVISTVPVTIDAQSATQVQASYTTTSTSRVIYVVADPNNVIPELDKTNNSGFVLLTNQFTDLSILRDGIVFPNPMPAAGQTASGHVVVRNAGLVAATHAEVVAYDDLPENGGVTAIDTFVDVPAQSSVSVPFSWTVRPGQRFATAIVNPTQVIPEPNYVNNRATRFYTVNGNGGPDIYLNGGPDLSQLVVDPLTLNVSGTVRLPLSSNNVSTPFLVTIFEDVDGDLAFNPEVDNPLGSVLVQPYGSEIAAVPVQGTVRFAPGHLMAYLDSGNAVAESNESNNLIDLYHDCETSAGSIAPRTAKWTSPTPTSSLTAVGRIIDTNGDGIIDQNDVPMVVVADRGGIVVERGDNGQPVWGVQLDASGKQISPVIADVDGDGKPEIIAHLDTDPVTGATNQHRLVALDAATGARKWVSPQLDRDPAWDLFIGFGIPYRYVGAPVVADLDGDGHPEVITGRTVLNGADGSVKWVGTGGSGRAWKDDPSSTLYNEQFPDQEAPIAVDLNGDGILEVIAGNTAYRADGSILWQRSDLPDGYTSPVWLGTDVNPHICLVAWGNVYMLNSDGTTLWGPVAIPGGALLGGAPTVYPWNGRQRVAVAGDGYLSAFDAATGGIVWTRQVANNLTSFGGTTTNSAAGIPINNTTYLFYASRDQFLLLGGDGGIVYTMPVPNEPYHPTEPVVADIDNDGNAEVIVPGDDAVRVLGDLSWPGAPTVFNESAYHVVNINDTGAVPTHEVQTSFSKANYRINSSNPLNGKWSIPNLTTSYPRVDGSAYPGSVNLTVRIGNNGWAAAPVVNVGFFQVNADGSSTSLGATQTSNGIPAGGYSDVTLTISNPPASFTFYAVADPANLIAECDKSDNRGPNYTVHLSADIAADPYSFFVSDPQPRPGDTITLAASASISGAVNTANLKAQFFLGDPAAGGTPVSPQLPVTLSSIKSAVTATVTYQWTVNAPSGPQSLYVFFDPSNLIPEDNETNNTAAVMLNVSTPDPIYKMSGSVVATPGSAEAGTPIAASILVQNIGNVPLSNVTLAWSVSGPSATGTTSGSTAIASLPKYNIASIPLGTFTPSANGTYTVTVTAASPVTLVSSPVNVVVGPFGAGTLSVVPTQVPVSLPIAQVHAHVSRANTIAVPDDPLLPLIRASMQRAASYEAGVMSDGSQNQCFRCHAHPFAMVGIESARKAGVSVNDTVLSNIFQFILGLRQPDGRMSPNSAGDTHQQTRLAAWCISHWHNVAEQQPVLGPMFDEVVADQNTDGSWQCGANCGSPSLSSQPWWTMTSIQTLAHAYDLTQSPAYLSSLTSGARWLVNWNYAATTANSAQDAARVAIGLQAAIPYLPADVAAAARDREAALIAFLRSFQNPDGSFGEDNGVPMTQRTAQVLEALIVSGAPPTDSAVRAATIFLLNQQLSSGSFFTSDPNAWPADAIDPTTAAILALNAFTRATSQLDVDLHLTLASTTSVAAVSPPTASTANGSEMIWHFPDVTDTGSDTYINLNFSGLQNGESQPIATAASISYADPNTGQTVSRPLTIPSITGVAPVGVTLATDQPTYGPNAPVTVRETITNASAGLTNDVVIRDGSGDTVATLTSNEAIGGLPPTTFPGWHFGVPVTLQVPSAGSSRNALISIDFGQQLATLGVTGTFDPNSIRVSTDAAPATELPFTFFPNAPGASAGTLVVQIGDDTPAGSALPIHVFFDIIENGFKPASLVDRNATGIGPGLLATYTQVDMSKSPGFGFATDPSQLALIPPPFDVLSNRSGHMTPPADVNLYQSWEVVMNGAFYAPVAGTYQFSIFSGWSCWLDVDGQRLIFNPSSSVPKIASITLTAGVHTVTGTMLRWGWSAYWFDIKWAPPGAGIDFIPSHNLFLAAPFPASLATLGTPGMVPTGSVTRTYTWNTGATAAAAYSAAATLHQSGGFAGSASAPFTIAAGSQLSASVATDKAAYDAGQTVHLSANAAYAAGNTPLSNLTAILSVVSPTGTTVASKSTAFPSLSPGQNVPLQFDWPDGAAPAGTYAATIVVKDAAGVVAAQASAPFQIRATSQSGAGIAGTLAAPATIAQTQSLPFAVTLTNGGNADVTNGSFAIRIVDPSTQNLIASAPFAASVAIGATASVQVPFDTSTLPIQKYQAWLVSLISGTAQPLANANFEVTAPPTVVTATAATDKTSYDAGDTLNETTTVTLVSAPEPLSGLTVTTTIAGTSSTSTIASIAPGSSATTTFDLPIGTTAPGSYTVTTVVKDANGVVLAQATSTFTITSTATTGKGISGTIATAPAVTQGSALPITVTITNNGNASITNAPFTVTVGSDTLSFNATVAMGATVSQQLSEPTGALTPGSQTATLASMITGSPVTLATTSFVVQVPTVVTATAATDKTSYDVGDTLNETTTVTLVSAPAPLSGLTVTTTIAGTSGTSTIASIAPGSSATTTFDLPIGTTAPGSYTVTTVVKDANGVVLAQATSTFTITSTATTGKGISGTIATAPTVTQGSALPITVTITNNGNTSITNAPFTVTVGSDTLSFNATVAMGATVTQQLSEPTGALTPGTQTATLASMITGSPVTLATASFTVNSSSPFTVGPSATPRVLLWSDCSSGNSVKPCTPTPPPFLTSTLTAACIPWTLVGDEDSFLAQLRSGGFTEAILDPPPTSEPHIAAELAETIHAGFGVLVIHDHPDAMPTLAAALGISFNGNLNATSTLLDLLATPIAKAGQMTVNGDGVRIDLGTAKAAALISATQLPAISYNVYGGGRVVVLPFDAEKTPSSDMAAFLLGGVTYVSRASGTDARSVIALDFAITAPVGGSENVTVNVTIPPALTVIAAPPSWSVTVPGGTTMHLTLRLRLPDTTGSYDVASTLVIAGQPVSTKTVTFTVTADRAAVESALASDLASLAATAPASDQHFIADAQTQLSAERAYGNSDAVNAINTLLTLVRDLQSLSGDITAARSDTDRLLVWWQSRVKQ